MEKVLPFSLRLLICNIALHGKSSVSILRLDVSLESALEFPVDSFLFVLDNYIVVVIFLLFVQFFHVGKQLSHVVCLLLDDVFDQLEVLLHFSVLPQNGFACRVLLRRRLNAKEMRIRVVVLRLFGSDF